MPRLSQTRVPSYRLHKQSGQAIVTLSGRDVCLGKFGTDDSREKYNRLVAEWITSGRQLIPNKEEITISEVIAAYWEFAQRYYRHGDGSPTEEVGCIKKALGPLRRLYGSTHASSFGPVALKAVREEMIKSGWCRTYINNQAGRIRRMFKWATENELVPASVFHGLMAVAGLKAGRCEAPESEPVRPVPEEHVFAILPFVSRQVAAMIKLQLLTAMRPGEVCVMRGRDLDTTGKLWLYRPPLHKTAHHGHERVIYLGPQGQALVKDFLRSDINAYIFSPAEAEAERRAAQHAARKTPFSCGNRPGTNRRQRSEQHPGDHYDVSSYRRAIARACTAADRKAHTENSDAKPEDVLIPTWHPHQLRHTAATNLRKDFGLEAAQVILGHKTLTVTQVYAERNVVAAHTIMAKVG
jgi:integrase